MQWLTPRQAAEKSGIHHTTIYRQAKAGKIKSTTVTKEFLRVAWDAKKKRICQPD